ncbi:carboxypeptidase B-like [Apostichopus japonicus]|uniref:carboxypeptidase B-like n=1 Tax=Stichopus japonicus TaxID=307972 RepID=UPI003AB2747F
MFLSVIFACLLASSLAVDYTGYKVIHAKPTNDNAVNIVNGLQDQFDLWKESRGIGYNADILVAPRDYASLRSFLESRGIQVEIMIEDVQPLIDAQMTPSATAGFYEQYHPLDEIEDWMTSFQSENPDKVRIEDVGDTFENRKVQKLVISNDLTASKPIFFMIGGTHSREWVGPATMMQVADWLVSGSTDLADHMEFHIIPVHNKDGYVHTWLSRFQGGDRMWRKTRKPSGGVNNCYGTDPNRNYEYKWNTGGSSSLPCSDTYMGTSAASEIEVSSLQDHVRAIKDNIQIFMDVHAYSQYWMYPWAYTDSTFCADKNELDAASKVAVEALEKVHGKVYKYGPISEVIYVASGSSADWAYNEGIKHSYALELRDEGQYGFTLPADQILPCAEEFYDGIDAMARHILGI